MAVTLNNIKFYHPPSLTLPPSLPRQPLKSTSANHNHTSISHHISKSSDITLNHSKLPFSSFSQPTLPHPLPPRPPVIFPSDRHTASATPSIQSSTSHSPSLHPVSKNDFDRALDAFLLSAKIGVKGEDGELSSHLPIPGKS